MPDESMRERVARAICLADGDNRLLGWRGYLEDAYQVLCALREPTAAMCWAAERYGDSEGYGRVSSYDAEYAWKEMIDAALAE